MKNLEKTLAILNWKKSNETEMSPYFFIIEGIKLPLILILSDQIPAMKFLYYLTLFLQQGASKSFHTDFYGPLPLGRKRSS